MQRFLNLLFIWVLIGALIGGYLYQFLDIAKPCSLCLLQRLAMISIGSCLCLNLKFGIRVEHYGLALLSALFGMAVSLRQIALHVCLTFPTFGTPVFGFDLYIWAFTIFFCSIFATAILLIFDGYTKHKEEPPHFGFFEKTTLTLLSLLVFANTLTTFLDCSYTLCP